MSPCKTWSENVEIELEKLAGIDFEYSLGENFLLPPLEQEVVAGLIANEFDSEAFVPELTDFYNICDGFCLSGVRNGYFVVPISELRLELQEKRLLPSKISGCFDGNIRVFGSDGGGCMFALRLGGTDILHLASGVVREGTFYADPKNARIVAGSFDEFLERILGDLRAFVAGEHWHVYIS